MTDKRPAHDTGQTRGVTGPRVSDREHVVIRAVRRPARVTGGAVDGAERSSPPVDEDMIATLLRRYLNGTLQRNDEIREQIRAYYRAHDRLPPI